MKAWKDSGDDSALNEALGIDSDIEKLRSLGANF